MKYLFILIFVLCYALSGTEAGYTNASPLWTHVAYNFQHAGVAHLVVNSLSFIAMFRLLEKFVTGWLLSVLAVASGFAASFLSMSEVPTVGASGMIYAMTGMFLSMSGLCPDIKILNRRLFAVFVFGIVVCMTVGALKGNSNILLHVFSLTGGLLAGAGIAFFRNGQVRCFRIKRKTVAND
jgi:membrane associated rhomboid family serine protease